MKRFDKKGMMIFPNPKKETELCKQEKLLVIGACFCPNGHSLISKRAVFDEFNGIAFKVRREGVSGNVAISPVFGCKCRVSLDVDLNQGEIWDFHCPECGVAMPVYMPCECGGSLVAFFTSNDAAITHSFAVCNRVGCQHADIHLSEELQIQTLSETGQ